MPGKRPVVTVKQLARVLRREVSVVHAWTKRGLLPFILLTENRRRVKFIIRRDAVRAVRYQRHTCTCRRAARELCVTYGYIGQLVKSGILKKIKLFGVTRIVMASIPRAKRRIGAGVVYPEKVGFARYSEDRRIEIARIGRSAQKSKGKPIVA